MTITVDLHSADGRVHRVDAQPGQSLMQAAVAAGVDGIAADCGGCLSCATCHVLVADDWLPRLPPIGPDEAAMLDATAVPREPGSRLACQVVITPGMDGLRARLPSTQY
jgi:2Fe-2S ferredoxin